MISTPKSGGFAITLVIALLFGTPALAETLLGSAVIRNSTIYEARELFDVYGPYIGKPVTPTTAARIADAVRDRYRDDGYSRPGYTVADDGTKSGIVRIDLVEASISGVSMSGDSGPHGERLEALLGDVPTDRALRPADIRDILQRARRLPGLDVNISTRPDTHGIGGYVLEVDSDYDAFGGSLTLTNRGTEQIGRNVAQASIVANGPFGGDGSVGLFAGSAEDSTAYSSTGMFFKSANERSGTQTLLQGSVAAVQIESDGIVVEQDRERYRLRVSQPLPERRGRNVRFMATLESDNVDIRHDGIAAQRERLRSMSGGMTMSWGSSRRQHLVTLEIDFGLNKVRSFAGESTPVAERLDDFVIVRGHYVDVKPLNASWSMRWDALVQYAPEVVPTIRQFKVGGGRIGRGFDAAALRGDRGMGGKFELRRLLAGSAGFAGRVDGYAFYDLGAAWQNDGAARQSGATAGLGLSLRGKHLVGYVELAKPLTHADADGQRDAGVFVELTGRF